MSSDSVTTSVVPRPARLGRVADLGLREGPQVRDVGVPSASTARRGDASAPASSVSTAQAGPSSSRTRCRRARRRRRCGRRPGGASRRRGRGRASAARSVDTSTGASQVPPTCASRRTRPPFPAHATSTSPPAPTCTLAEPTPASAGSGATCVDHPGAGLVRRVVEALAPRRPCGRRRCGPRRPARWRGRARAMPVAPRGRSDVQVPSACSTACHSPGWLPAPASSAGDPAPGAQAAGRVAPRGRARCRSPQPSPSSPHASLTRVVVQPAPRPIVGRRQDPVVGVRAPASSSRARSRAGSCRPGRRARSGDPSWYDARGDVARPVAAVEPRRRPCPTPYSAQATTGVPSGADATTVGGGLGAVHDRDGPRARPAARRCAAAVAVGVARRSRRSGGCPP